MRVLMVNETARPHTGGLNRMVLDSIRWLQAFHHDVALAYADGEPSTATCPAFAFPKHSPLPALQMAVEHILKEFRPDVVQAHVSDPPELLSEFSRRIPLCLFVHDQSFFCSGGDRMTGSFSPCHRPHGLSCLFWHYAQRCGGKNPSGNWERWQRVQAKQRLRQLIQQRVRLQVASQFMQRGLIENGYAESNIDVIPLFADPPSGPSLTEPGLLLAACRLVKSKGVHFLLRALADMTGSDWRLAVAGAGPERGRLEQLAVRLGLSHRVRFLGELLPEQLDQWYRRAAIVLSPVLRPEPFGMIGIEAMAHGVPVIAFDGGATEEWLAHDQTGMVVRERTPQGLSHAIRRLLNDLQKREALATASRRAWERFTPQRFVERVVASFERTIQAVAKSK